MNDSRLIDRLAGTDLYPDAADLPEVMRADIVLLDIARRMEMDTMERTPVEAVKPPPRRRSGPMIALAAFGLVLVIGVAGLWLANLDRAEPEPANPPATTAAPQIDTSRGAAALIGQTWAVVDGRSFSRPDRIEFAADGTYQVFDGPPVAGGVATADGEVITFVADPTDEVTWVFNDAFLRATESCEGVEGRYRVVFTDAASVTLEVISDGCPPRIGVANGLVLEPAQ